MRYAGGKGGAGVYQTIINLIPPHRVYIETHTGGGNIFERKAPAAHSILLDIDPSICDTWRARLASTTSAGDGAPSSGATVICADAAGWLRSRSWTGGEFVYCDPPYVMSARRGGAIYRHEYSDSDHVDLLGVLLSIPAPVMLSGYRTPLYDDMLGGWRSFDFKAMTRRGPATETVWLNYDPPAVLHDFTYAGKDYRDRERIKKKRARWVAKLEKLDPMERAAVLDALLDLVPAEMAMSIAQRRK